MLYDRVNVKRVSDVDDVLSHSEQDFQTLKKSRPKSKDKKVKSKDKPIRPIQPNFGNTNQQEKRTKPTKTFDRIN